MYLMVDLCSGLGGASQSFKDNGWKVITVDNEAKFEPTICADIRSLRGSDITTENVTLVWASPPCTEFSYDSLPWGRGKRKPDTSLVLECYRIIKELNPDYWVVENVKGSVKYISPILGKPVRKGPWYLWGNFPLFNPVGDLSKHAGALGYGPSTKIRKRHPKEWYAGSPAERARIPISISRALRVAIEQIS